MPAYRVILLPEALADLQSIHAHIAADSPDNAARMAGRILDAIDGLETLPNRFPLVSTRRRIGYELRAVVVRPYKIFYSMQGETIYVRTIRHGARRQWP